MKCKLCKFFTATERDKCCYACSYARLEDELDGDEV
jgi:hypothetical protein